MLAQKNIKIASNDTRFFVCGFDIKGSDANETLTGTNIQDRINGGAGVLWAWINQTTTADYLLAAA